MRTFEQGNWSNGSVCKLCAESTSGEVILVPINGTKDGNNIEACQVHTKCLSERLMFYPDYNLLIAKGDEKNEE